MANFRLIGQDVTAFGPQKLAAVADTLQISGVSPTGAGTPLTISPVAAFTAGSGALHVASGAGQNLLVLNSVAAAGTGTNTAFRVNDNSGVSLMSLDDSGALTLRGAAVVGTGTSSVAGPINFNGNVVFGDAATDTVTFARGWSDGTAVSYSKSLDLTPVGTPSFGTNAGVSILVGTDAATPNGDVVAAKGSLLLQNNGTAWINTDGTSAWSQLAAGSGNSLQAAYDVGKTILTTGVALPVDITSVAAGTALKLTTSGAGTALSLNSAAAAGSLLTATDGAQAVLSLDATASGYSLSPAAAAPATAGSAISVTSGAGGTTGVGGALALASGAGGTTSAGGAITLTAGAGGSTSGAGGAITITSGDGDTAGAVSLQTGTGTPSTIDIGTTNTPAITLGNTVLAISTAGALTATPTSGQAATITTAGAGTIDVTSATGAISVTSSDAAASGAITLLSSTTADASASGNLGLISSAGGNGSTAGNVAVTSSASSGTAGTVSVSSSGSISSDVSLYSSATFLGSGDVYVYTNTSNAALGGVVLSAGPIAPAAPASGAIEIRSNADTTVVAVGEITFSAGGTAGPDYSQASDRTLDTTLFPSSVTSIVGALNELASSDSSVTYGVDAALVPVITTGTVLTIDTTHNAKPAVLTAGSQAILGISLDSSATLTADTVRAITSGEITVLQAAVDETGAGGVAALGSPLYLSATTALGYNLSTTAPTGSGELLLRVGWVTDATAGGPYKVAIAFSDGVTL